MIVVQADSAGLLPVTTTWDADILQATVAGKRYQVARVKDDSGMRDDEASFIQLYRNLRADNWHPRACADCVFFRSSGLAQQFSGRRSGYCAKVGFRKRHATVTIDHDCGEHEHVRGWPDDLQRARQERLARSDAAPYPSRAASIEAALAGFVIFESLAASDPPATGPSPAPSATWKPPAIKIEVADSVVLSCVDQLLEGSDPQPIERVRRVFYQNATWRNTPTQPSDRDDSTVSRGTAAAIGLAAGLCVWSQPRQLGGWMDAEQDALTREADDSSGRDISRALAVLHWTTLAMQKRTCPQISSTLLDEDSPAGDTATRQWIKRLLSSFCHHHHVSGTASQAIVRWHDANLTTDTRGPATTSPAIDGDDSSWWAAAILSAITGAYQGREALPDDWWMALENRQQLVQRAQQLDQLNQPD